MWWSPKRTKKTKQENEVLMNYDNERLGKIVKELAAHINDLDKEKYPIIMTACNLLLVSYVNENLCDGAEFLLNDVIENNESIGNWKITVEKIEEEN